MVPHFLFPNRIRSLSLRSLHILPISQFSSLAFFLFPIIMEFTLDLSPLLLLQSAPDHQLLATFMSGSAVVFAVTPHSHSLIAQYRLPSPATAAYRDALYTVFGCADGGVRVYAGACEQPALYWPAHRDRILCVYICNNVLYLWTLSSQLTLVDVGTLAPIARVHFDHEITAITHMPALIHLQPGPMVCVAWSNRMPPFLMHAGDSRQIEQQYKSIAIRHLQLQQSSNPQQQIYLLQYSSNSRHIVSATTTTLNPAYYILIYSIAQQQTVLLCQPLLKLVLQSQPYHLCMAYPLLVYSAGEGVHGVELADRRKRMLVSSNNRRYVLMVEGSGEGSGEGSMLVSCRAVNEYIGKMAKGKRGKIEVTLLRETGKWQPDISNTNSPSLLEQINQQ